MNAKVKGSKFKKETGKQEIKENIFARREGKCSTYGGNNVVECEAD